MQDEPKAGMARTDMDPISAIDVFTHMKPAHATRYIQINPAVPPLISAIIEVLHTVSCLWHA
jgi:hypothetical protein